MRPPVGAVESAQGAVAQGSAHDVTDGRQIVDLRCQLGASPATPGWRDVAGVGRNLVDAPGNLAPYELGLQLVDTRHALLALIVFRQLPEPPLAMSARPA